MTENKIRQEGPPAADPAQQEPSGGPDPEAIREGPPAKKKKIIIVKGSDSKITAADTRPDMETEAEGADWQDMTPHEFIEYAQENPEAAKQDIKDYFSTGQGKEAADNLITAAQGVAAAVNLTQQALNNVISTGGAAEIVARRMHEVQFDISKVIDAIARANQFINIPDDADAEKLDNFYTELDTLEPFIDAILADDPARKDWKTNDLLETIPYWAVFYLDDPGAIEEKAQDAQEAADIKAAIEIIEKARAARDQAKKEQVFIDPLGLKNAEFFPLLNGALTNGLMRLTARDFAVDKEGTVKAYYTSPQGNKYTLDQIDKLMGELGVSAKKILDTAALYLTKQNFYRGGKNINPTVFIPVKDYAEANGLILSPAPTDTKEEQIKENKRIKDRIKDFKNKIRRDLSDLSKLTWTAEETEGKNRGDYVDLRIISGHSVRGGIIKVNFDIDAARYLVNGYEFQYPKILLKIDNRKPNTYSIGRKIALHNSMDNNFMIGTDCTLSVLKLLEAAPEIPTKQELDDTAQRNWKLRIKKPLEKALNELTGDYPLLSKWEYRHPKTGAVYTDTATQALKWEDYSQLLVDWTMKEQPPGQAERREKKLQEKAAAEAAAGANATKKKRGRPKKQATQ